MTIVAVIPQVLVPVGPGSFASPSDIDPAVVVAVVTLLQIGWPGAGDVAFTYDVAYSNDSGVTWQPQQAGDVLDIPTPAFGAFPAGTMRFGINVPEVGVATRRLRMSYNMAKALTVSGKIEAF